jgi:hypothetical protein
MVLATDSTSLSSLIYKIEPGPGEKSSIFGGPTTTGIVPEEYQHPLSASFPNIRTVSR